jgi:hypothetical protein
MEQLTGFLLVDLVLLTILFSLDAGNALFVVILSSGGFLLRAAHSAVGSISVSSLR